MNRMEIPFSKPSITGAEIKEVSETLKGEGLRTGSPIKAFEKEFAAYLKHRHAVAVNSGRAALRLALEAIGLKPGEGVLVPTMSFAATAEVLRYFDALPILVDCNPEDFNLDVADAEQRLQRAIARGIKVPAIVPVHFAGQIGDVMGVRRLAEQYHLNVLEDAAHCCPAFYREDAEQSWKTVGTSADISCFSFEANPPIRTAGGGMACTERSDYAECMRTRLLHDVSTQTRKKFSFESHWQFAIAAPDCPYNLTDVAAAIGLHQLRQADQLQMMRTRVAGQYEQLLSEVEEITLPGVHPDRIHSWHRYIIRLQLEALSIDRAEVVRQLKDAGIATSAQYLPLHMQVYYREGFGYVPEDLPGAARICPELLALPNYPDMTPDEVEYVSYHLQQILARHQKCVHLSVVGASEMVGGKSADERQF